MRNAAVRCTVLTLVMAANACARSNPTQPAGAHTTQPLLRDDASMRLISDPLPATAPEASTPH